MHDTACARWTTAAYCFTINEKMIDVRIVTRVRVSRLQACGRRSRKSRRYHQTCYCNTLLLFALLRARRTLHGRHHPAEAAKAVSS